MLETETSGRGDCDAAQAQAPEGDKSAMDISINSAEKEPVSNDGDGVEAMDVDPVLDSPVSTKENTKNKNENSAPMTPTTPTPTNSTQTPTSSRLTEQNCFKTPEPVGTGTPTSSKKRKRLTPEQISQRDKERLEKRRKLEEEKQKKEEERLEKVRQKEEEKNRKEEEKRRQEEEKRLEKQRKDEEKKRIEEEKRQERLKKEEEKKRMDEEKKRVEEEKKQERLKKEEERKRKEEERKQKLEEKERERLKMEEKKAKQAKMFTNFFQKPSTPKPPPIITIENGDIKMDQSDHSGDKPAEINGPETASSKSSNIFNPLPFQIKTDMAVAPIRRRSKLSTKERECLDAVFATRKSSDGEEIPNDTCTLAIDNCRKSLKEMRGRSGRTEVKNEKDSNSNEVQILEDNMENTGKLKSVPGYVKWRIKLLQFHDNRRPPYWGTWKRKTKAVKPRRPITKEQDIDYEFDSDDEWEDEPEDAEELGDSEKDDVDDQDDGGDGDEDEEGWMVPHGYLSDSEREGTGADLESMKTKEKEFYKSLKENTKIGLPYIEVERLSLYTLRICPVYKPIPIVKPARKRTKKQEPSTEKKPDPEMASNEKKDKPRRSTRKPKIPASTTSNPYAQPPSGFMAMEFPSDEEDDEWAVVKMESSPSQSSASESEESIEDDSTDADSEDSDDEGNESESEGSESSDSNGEDLFIPIVTKKPKKA